MPGSTQVVDAQTIRVTVDVVADKLLGSLGLSVTDATGTASCDACLTITQRPALTDVPTRTFGQGVVLRDIRIYGYRFVPGSRVTSSAGTVTSTTYLSSGELEALITVPVDKVPRTHSLTVTNPDGGRVACACIDVVAAPRLSTMSPDTVRRNSIRSVTLRGSGFDRAPKLLGPAGVTFEGITVVNSTMLRATMTVDGTAAAAPKQRITVINSFRAGCGTTWAPLLTVKGAAQ